MKRTSLLLLLLLAGCASRTWTEATETTRPTGPRRETTQDQPRAGEYFELRTNLEVDGFTHTDTAFADDHGKLNLELLTPALQCLRYGHTITLELVTVEDQKVVYTKQIDEAAARDVIRECSIQAELGATMHLRERAADLLDKLIDATGEQPLRDELDAIRVKVQLRPSWE